MKYAVKLTLSQAKSFGIVCCKHCGYPRNNHFSWDSMRCARDKTCPGYEPSFLVGKKL